LKSKLREKSNPRRRKEEEEEEEEEELAQNGAR